VHLTPGGTEKLSGIFATLALATVFGPAAEAEPNAALIGVTVADCDLAKNPGCSGMARAFPDQLEQIHKLKGETEPWKTPYVPLSELEIAVMHKLGDALLGAPGTPFPNEFNLQPTDFRTDSKLLDSFDEARQVLAADSCTAPTDVSLTYASDTTERYGVLMFSCRYNDKVAREAVTVGLRDSRISHIYINWVVKIYASLPDKTQ
jgi:hypothetical protein